MESIQKKEVFSLKVTFYIYTVHITWYIYFFDLLINLLQLLIIFVNTCTILIVVLLVFH